MIRILVAAIVSLMLTAGASAQSTCPTIVYGAVLTAGQWNQCFANKQDALGYTAVNQAGDTMVGRLTTTASTTFRSGLSISPGVAPTAPVNGDIWVTASGIYVQINGTTVGPLTATGSAVPSVVQGDILYGSGVSTLATLSKSVSATRYLSNTGTNSNPAWAQVDLGTGVTGLLPIANIANGTQDTVLGYFGSTAIASSGVPNCGGALTYSTSSHGFGCNASGGVFASGTPTLGQFATWTNSTTIQGITQGYGITSALAASLTTASNSLGANVNMTATNTYFDGPSMAQGTTGTWHVTGNVTVTNLSAAAEIDCKLWDGTNAAIDSGASAVWTNNARINIALSGNVTSPAGNMRISCKDPSTTTSTMEFNRTGNSKDSSIFGIRIQ